MENCGKGMNAHAKAFNAVVVKTWLISKMIVAVSVSEHAAIFFSFLGSGFICFPCFFACHLICGAGQQCWNLRNTRTSPHPS